MTEEKQSVINVNDLGSIAKKKWVVRTVKHLLKTGELKVEQDNHQEDAC